MFLLLLQNRENPGRREVTRSPGADRCSPDQNTVAIDIGSLLGDADDHDHRTCGYGFGHPQELAFLQLADWRIDGHGVLCAPEGDGVGERRRVQPPTHYAKRQPNRISRPTPGGHMNFPGECRSTTDCLHWILRSW